jgi:hypothetical protein
MTTSFGPVSEVGLCRGPEKRNRAIQKSFHFYFPK